MKKLIFLPIVCFLISFSSKASLTVVNNTGCEINFSVFCVDEATPLQNGCDYYQSQAFTVSGNSSKSFGNTSALGACYIPGGGMRIPARDQQWTSVKFWFSSTCDYLAYGIGPCSSNPTYWHGTYTCPFCGGSYLEATWSEPTPGNVTLTFSNF